MIQTGYTILHKVGNIGQQKVENTLNFLYLEIFHFDMSFLRMRNRSNRYCPPSGEPTLHVTLRIGSTLGLTL